MDASYVIWGVAFDVTITLLLGVLVICVAKLMRHDSRASGANPVDRANGEAQRKKDRHALMLLMNQKTDNMLSALAIAIEQERQKLGMNVRNPSITEDIDACKRPVLEISCQTQTDEHEKILSLAQDGTAIPTIARQLEMSEAEVTLVMRLNAA